MMRAFTFLTVALFALLASTPTYAANIFVVNGERPYVGIEGHFDYKDDETFRTKVAGLHDAVIVFSSNGGNLVAALNIGYEIRERGFTTQVLDNTMCASACALAWLGGAKRISAPTARIGFHEASEIGSDGKAVSSAIGNALVGAYLDHLGIAAKALVFVVRTPTSSIAILTPDIASRVGIDMVVKGEGVRVAGGTAAPLTTGRSVAIQQRP